MSHFECPSCDMSCRPETEDLPDRIDSVEYECEHCGQEMQIGWAEVLEVRGVTVPLGDIVED